MVPAGQRGRRIGLFVILAALWFLPDPAGAEEVSVEDLKARLERLEKHMEHLQQENEELRRAYQGASQRAEESEAPGDDSGRAAVPEKQVQKIVTDYLKKQDEKKKANEEKAKKEAEEKGHEVGSDLSAKSHWRDGFIAETAARDFRIHFGGRFQSDAAWFKPDNALNKAFPNSWEDGADFRRVRFRADGTAWDIHDFVLELEFSQAINGTTQHVFATDVFVDFKSIPFLGSVAIGHFKEPFSLVDYGTPDSYGVFMERGVDDTFTPDRNMGIMMHDTYCKDSVILAAGVFRTNSDSRSGNVFDYGDGEYAYTSRLVFVPYSEGDGRCWLLFGPAITHRILDPSDAGLNNTNPSRARFATRPPIRVNSPALVDTGNMQADHFDFYNFQAALNLGSFLLQGEYYNAQVTNIRRGTAAPGIPRLLTGAFDGFYVQASYFLTGEYHPLDRKWGRLARVRPNEQWFFTRRGDKDSSKGFCHGLGAWELGVRYDYVDLRSGALNGFSAVRGVANSAIAPVATAGIEQDFTFSLSCYLNPQIRMQANYVHAFRGVANPALRGDVDILGMRLWFDF